MVAEGNVQTFLFLNFEKEEKDGKVVLPPLVDTDDPSLEQVSVKRLKSVEKGYIYPYISMSVIRSHSTDVNNNNFYKNELGGIFECIQTICELKKNCRFGSQKKSNFAISDDGYLIFAYKTMEDMYNSNFVASWKTWTGARLLCSLLPERHIIKRISFFKKIGGCDGFSYILIAQIQNLMVDCAPALNVLHYMKPKICAVVGAYRGITFKVDHELLSTLKVAEEDYISAFTSKLKVLYSNNTAELEFPDYLEFRENDAVANESCQTETIQKIMVSEETQTVTEYIPPERRRILPRTISIYDFPSMQDQAEFTVPFKLPTEVDMKQLTLNSHLKDCPLGFWKRRSSRITGRVVFVNEVSTDPDVMSWEKGNMRIDVNSNEEARIDEDVERPLKREDSLLSRLKEKYFNSPDYTREEILNE